MIAKSKLREKTFEFLAENSELRAETDYENFKRLMIDRFQAEESMIDRMNKFMMCRQMPGQDVRQYSMCLKNAATRRD